MRLARLACIAVLMLGVVWPISGCSALRVRGPRENAIRLESRIRATELEPAWRTAVYAYRDANTADIVLSSWSVAELRRFGEIGRIRPGSMLHVHYFLQPAAGRTPIDFTSQNASMRMFVIASEEGNVAGRYGGGGFMLPDGRPGLERFGGVVREATMRPVELTPGFEDVLGVAVLDGTVSARRDEATTDALLDWVEELERTRFARDGQ
ncbi:MAG: hypothetical protein AAGI30_04175 [Planctomycetota bacterium]